MAVYLLSDPHFSHHNIMKYEKSRQQFIDTEHMDNAIIENYNHTIEENDIVFWLGDMFFCNTARMEYIASRLTKGRNILIRGNHDGGVSDSKFIRLGFLPHRMYLYNGVMLTHEPISETNMKHLFNISIRKNICGHVHSAIDDLNPTIYQCVSVENINYKPIGFMEVMNRFRDGEAWRKFSERKQK